MASLSDEPTHLSTSIIKSDRIGRTHYSAQYREDVLSAFDKSGLSGPTFARQCGIKYPTFASWVTKRRKSSREPEDSHSNSPFIIAEFHEPVPNNQALQIQLPTGVIATMTSAHQAPLLAALIKALA